MTHAKNQNLGIWFLACVILPGLIGFKRAFVNWKLRRTLRRSTPAGISVSLPVTFKERLYLRADTHFLSDPPFVPQPFFKLHVRSLPMLHTPLVVDWISLSKSMSSFYSSIPSNVFYLSRLDSTTEKVDSLALRQHFFYDFCSLDNFFFSKHLLLLK